MQGTYTNFGSLIKTLPDNKETQSKHNVSVQKAVLHATQVPLIESRSDPKEGLKQQEKCSFIPNCLRLT